MYYTKNHACARPSFQNSFFNDRSFFNPMISGNWSNQPATNIAENDKEFIIELAIPGMEKKDFTVHVEANHLMIKGEKQVEQSETKEKYTRREFSFTKFSRTFILPENADGQAIQAAYNNGILEIKVAKKVADQVSASRSITIN